MKGVKMKGPFASGANNTLIVVNDVKLYFSYQTLVAFEKNGELVVSENLWGTTTGKHINAIDGGGQASEVRLSRVSFEQQAEAL